jgi:HSP20 family molecular chaperone IbpA
MIYLDPALEIVWTPRHIEKWRPKTETKGGEVAMLVKRFETLDDPFRRIESELTGLLGRTGLVASGREGRLTPPVEILGADSELVIRAELPGVDPDSVDVTLDDSTLRVRAERRIPTTEQGEYLRREFAYGTFECSVVLPAGPGPGRYLREEGTQGRKLNAPWVRKGRAHARPFSVPSLETPAGSRHICW